MPTVVTFKTDDARIVEFTPSKGDVERQVAAFLRSVPGFEERFRRAAKDGAVEVVFVRETNRGSVWLGPRDEIVVPMSPREMSDLSNECRHLLKYGVTEPKDALRWVVRCESLVADVLADRADVNALAMFWIHVCETLVRIRAWAEQNRGTHDDADPMAIRDGRLRASIEVDEACARLSATMNEDDLWAAVYFRHRSAHFSTTAFRVGKAGKVEPFPTPPTDEVVERLFGLDEAAESKRIAAKVAPHVGRLREALLGYPESPLNRRSSSRNGRWER